MLTDIFIKIQVKTSPLQAPLNVPRLVCLVSWASTVLRDQVAIRNVLTSYRKVKQYSHRAGPSRVQSNSRDTDRTNQPRTHIPMPRSPHPRHATHLTPDNTRTHQLNRRHHDCKQWFTTSSNVNSSRREQIPTMFLIWPPSSQQK